MRDLFAIMAIIAAVVGLGVFRVPSEDALVAAGIRAAAEGAVYQARHPIAVSVQGRVVTAEGRVESELERRRVIADLAALDGVDEVVDRLTVLPTVAPFTLEITKAETVIMAGHVVRAAQRRALEGLFDAPGDGLLLAAGAPDRAWEGAVRDAAGALARMRNGALSVSDRQITLRGEVHRPTQLQDIRDRLADVPDGYAVTLDVAVLDDGRPYSLLAVRDRRMGLTLSGKLPPDWDDAVFAGLGPVNHGDLARAPLPLNQPGFAPLAQAGLAVFGQLDEGALSIAPGMLSLSGGPATPDILAQAEALAELAPPDHQVHLALVPLDEGGPLALRVDWDGATLSASGRVPLDFAARMFERPFAGATLEASLARAPYPDLTDWDAPLRPGLRALAKLQAGRLLLDGDGLRLAGVAADPDARRAAQMALGGAGQIDLRLADDGRPVSFTLDYEAGRGARLSGKVPAALSPTAMAELLGLPGLRGAPQVAPEGDGGAAIEALRTVAPVLPVLETLEMQVRSDDAHLAMTVTPGVDPETLRVLLQPDWPDRVPLTLAPAAAPPDGARRTHAVLGQPQVAADGHWLPQLGAPPTVQGCEDKRADLPALRWAPGSFVLDIDAVWPLAHLAALGRACARFAGLAMVVELQASDASIPALNQQIARRRAETVQAALLERGVPQAALRVIGHAGDGVTAMIVRWEAAQ